ncbi:AT-rich interactive domain-containing protein 5A [Rhea pennata]|uniref:AT-rich interactive domain-containing protein 5A n=1 Tax=Rhea pennata TaxID=8795 RepID=UPI002E273776
MEEEEGQAPAAPPEDEPKSEGNGAAAAESPEPAPAPGGPEGEEERPKAAEEEEAAGGGEKEEEEAFLVSLYKFMKDRHTPIERIPHLGFKQINLWKIYKAVEKLGAYELVTGRRLWKNVYDELGGSPGSTSAATCTRRHYERLVLPYVRHLKGEDDKPLPPAKPRRQYKVSKEPKGHEGGEKSRRAKKEKSREQVPAGTAAPAPDVPERGRPADGAAAAARGGPCRSPADACKRLFSSFCSEGNHGIMSPLAKKKLLAQVSKAEASHCHKRHCPESRRPAGAARPEPPAAAAGSSHPAERGSPVGEDGGGGTGPPLGPAVFTGCFHAYRPGGLAASCRPPPPRCASPELSEPPREAWGGGGPAPRTRGPSPAAFAAVHGCWVPPSAAFAPPSRAKRALEEDEEEEDDDEEAFGPGQKLRAVSPFGKDEGARSPGGRQGLAKPKAVVAGPGYPAPLPAAVPRIADVYTGAMLRFPASFGNPLERLRSHGTPLAPALSVNPFVIPAFPSPLVTASPQPSEPCRPLATGPGRYATTSYGGSPRPRLYPAAAWHGQLAYASPPAFRRGAEL